MVSEASNVETKTGLSFAGNRSIVDAYAEGQRYFMGQGTLNNTLLQVTTDLKEQGIDYIVIGAVALLAHGYRRFTEDIDLVLTPKGLEAFHQKLVGLDCEPAFPDARKKFNSNRHSIGIVVMTTGDYPGDGKPKPVSVPDPAAASTEMDGVRFVTFENLIELKLASGMTAPHRLKDLADVQELIKIRGLESDFAERLDPYVRDEFFELCEAVQGNNRKTEEQ